MKTNNFSTPMPRLEVAGSTLMRPDWTTGSYRKRNMLWLDKNENSDPILSEVTSRILATVSREVLYSYPENVNLYKKLADHLHLDPSNLLLTAGSDGAIRSAFEAYISPGDVVIHTQPTFAMYSVYSRMYGADAQPVEYLPSSDGPKLSEERIIDAVKKKHPKMVCLPNPDSPTGTVLTKKELRAIVAAAGEVGALILVDEAYYPFHKETIIQWVKEYPHLVVARSTGKAWGLAGLRIGYAAANSEVTKILHKVRPMYEVNTIAVTMMEKMLDYHDEMLASVRRLEEGKQLFIKEMRSLGFRVLDCHGNFVHVSFGNYEEEIHLELSSLVYYRRSFNDPCLQGFSRFSAATPEIFKPVIDSIKMIVKQKEKGE